MLAVQNWREEMQSAWLYRRLAQIEDDPTKRSLFQALAQAAESQADIWREEIVRQGGAVPKFAPAVRARVVAWLTERLRPRAMLAVLSAMKIRGVSVYRAAAAGHAMPTDVTQIGSRHHGMHGNNLRAAVFGVNDGLISNTSLIMGVAGATHQAGFILTSGVAGLLAGAASMAAGEYVSMRSQREMYEYQIGLERDELARYPDEEAEELALIYQARGMDITQARGAAHAMMRDPAHALDTLAREELGLNPADLGSPWSAAVASFITFAAGAVIPLLPFLDGMTSHSIALSAALAVVCLFAVGAAISLFTGRGALRSGWRMVFIGGGAAAATYAIGTFLGVRPR